MMRHYAASNGAILGHIAHLAGTEEAALAQYRQSVRLLPNDQALQELVRAASCSLRRQYR